MKFFLSFILIAVCLLVFNQKEILVPIKEVIVKARGESKSLAMIAQNQNQPLNETHQSEVSQQADFFEIESQFRGLSSEVLQQTLDQISADLEKRAYIRRANQNRLSAEERAHLGSLLRSMTVIRKLLIEKQLEIAERFL